MLTLPIKRIWFDMILSGEKKEEYRSLSKHYERVFREVADGKTKFQCRIRNGYAATCPSAILICTCRIGRGRKKWGAESGVRYFVLKILSFEKE